ncbi:MAG: hypothetical protein R3202_01570 [Candidatus Competibacterales bacterium]|nr:hypothetical protein [Candidatus Competibacterales bacterium]
MQRYAVVLASSFLLGAVAAAAAIPVKPVEPETKVVQSAMVSGVARAPVVLRDCTPAPEATRQSPSRLEELLLQHRAVSRMAMNTPLPVAGQIRPGACD